MTTKNTSTEPEISTFHERRAKNLLFILLVIPCFVFLSGCIWRTASEDHYFGPVLVRETNATQEKAFVSQQVHFPFVLEGGTQWGVSLGYQKRIVAVPQELTGKSQKQIAEPGSNVTDPSTDTEEWEWKLHYYYSYPHSDSEPVFIARTNVGLAFGVGNEINALTIGGSWTTEFRPKEHTHYYFQYPSSQPENIVLKSCSVEKKCPLNLFINHLKKMEELNK